MEKSVLIIEDEEKIRRVIKDYLEYEDIIVFEAGEGKSGLDIFDSEDIDLVILDIMLPGDDGWTICRKIREESDVVIVMLTAKSEETDELMGYDLGADDYIKKPFSPKVLRAKIQTLLDRMKEFNHVDNETLLAGKNIKINISSREVYLKKEKISLTLKEYELLMYFVKNRNIALSRDQIVCNVWGYDFDGSDRIVDTTVRRLRSKTRPENLPIEAIRSYGYKLGDAI